MKFIAAAFLIPLVIIMNDPKPRLRADELLFASGRWKGSLTYIDYGTGKPYTMTANLDITIPVSMPGQVIIFNEYPNEPKANGYDTLRISKSGRYLDGELLLEKKIIEKNLLIITEKMGMDDNRPATIRHRYTIGPHDLIIYKEVRFNAADSFRMRHEYRMSH